MLLLIVCYRQKREKGEEPVSRSYHQIHDTSKYMIDDRWLMIDDWWYSLGVENGLLIADAGLDRQPISRAQIWRRERGQGKIFWPCLADHKQDWQPYMLLEPKNCWKCWPYIYCNDSGCISLQLMSMATATTMTIIHFVQRTKCILLFHVLVESCEAFQTTTTKYTSILISASENNNDDEMRNSY